MSHEAVDLAAAMDRSDFDFDDMAGGNDDWTFPDSWVISGVDNLVEASSGPYEPGEVIQAEMQFTGAGQYHSNVANKSTNYTEQGSSGGEVTPRSNDVYPTIEFEVASDAPDGDYTVHATYDEPFNSGATDVGTQQSMTVTVEGYSVTLTASPESDTEIELSYDIANGSPDYDVVIDRKLESESDSAFSTVHTDTHSSEGTYTHVDGGLSDENTYEYRVQVTDNGGIGETVQDRDTASPVGVS